MTCVLIRENWWRRIWISIYTQQTNGQMCQVRNFAVKKEICRRSRSAWNCREMDQHFSLSRAPSSCVFAPSWLPAALADSQHASTQNWRLMQPAQLNGSPGCIASKWRGSFAGAARDHIAARNLDIATCFQLWEEHFRTLIDHCSRLRVYNGTAHQHFG